jgi:NADH-quinone oxidoreductase subunit K
LAIFFTGFYGIVFNFKNFLVTMLCIELTYLGSSFVFIINGVYFLEPTGQLYALTLILLAASEAAVGLGLLIVLYKKAKRIDLGHFYSLAG